MRMPVMMASGLRTTRSVARYVALLVLTAGCSVDAPTSTRVPSRPSFGKTPAGLTVTSTNPSYAHRGDTQLSVHVFGSGFATGAKAKWSLGSDTTSVTTTAMTFVSSTELVATITVSGTAPLALYDVTVMNLDGKKGVGAELFAVTSAVVVGSGTLGGDVIVNEINDSEQVVGYFDRAGPFITQGTTIISLGATGQANGVSPTGDIVVGRDDAPVAWIRQSSGGYVRETLPAMFSAGGGAWHAAQGPNGLLVAGYQRTSNSKQSATTQPVVWTRTGTGWSGPVAYVNTGTNGTGLAISSSGKMMGKGSLADGTATYGIWDSQSLFVPITSPYMQSMNDAATIAVGAGPAMWFRDAVTQQWNPNAFALPTGSDASCGGSAQDVNDDGIIVGYTCKGATLWRVDVSVSPPVVTYGPINLVGLGGNGTNSSARADAVTSTYPYVIAGGAVSGGHRLLVKWKPFE